MDQNGYNNIIHEPEPGVKTYIIGYLFASVLTLISFGLVMLHGMPKAMILGGLIVAAVFQVFVHLYFFLHLNASKPQRWNVGVFAFTALLVVIFIAISLWVMYTLNSRMM